MCLFLHIFWDIFQCTYLYTVFIYIYIYTHTVTSPISSTWNKWKSWWVSPVFHHAVLWTFPAAIIGLGMWWFGAMQDLSTTLSGPLVGWFLKINTVYYREKRDCYSTHSTHYCRVYEIPYDFWNSCSPASSVLESDKRVLSRLDMAPLQVCRCRGLFDGTFLGWLSDPTGA